MPVDHSDVYVTMSDGIDVAVRVHRPDGRGHGCHDLRELLRLPGPDRVEECPPDLLDVRRRGRLQRGEASVGEPGKLAPAIGFAVEPFHPAAFFQSRHSVRQPALAGGRDLGELAHPQQPAVGLRQPHQDLVVAERYPRLAL